MGRETIPSPDDLLLLPEVAEITAGASIPSVGCATAEKGRAGTALDGRLHRRHDVMAWLDEQERQAEDAPGRSPQPAA